MYEFRLPDIGEGLHEAEVVRWLVAEGERVARDQPLVEVMTDKATVEIPSPVAGTVVSIQVPAGQTAKVGDVLVVLEAAGAAPAGRAGGAPAGAEGAAAAPGVAAPAGTPAEPSAGGPARRILAAPSVRKRARDLGVDLARVPATGPGGRITMEDVERFAGQRQGAPDGVTAPAAPATPAADAAGPAVRAASPAAPAPAAPAPAAPAPAAAPAGTEDVVPLLGLRRRIAERLSRAWREIPHVTSHEEVDVTALAALRDRLAARAEAAGVKLTWMPLVVKAVTIALKDHPYLNATFDEAQGAIVLKRYYHIGVATAVPDGLLVPVIRDADRKSVLAIARELADLVERAHAKTLTASELQGSTFTITNYGRFGGTYGTPIINPPEVAILGVGRVAERPVVRDGQVAVRLTMPLSLSFDHRVIDGEGAARFLNQVAELLSDPDELLLRLG